MSISKEENEIVMKMSLGFNKEYTNYINELSRKLERSRAATIRKIVKYSYQKLVLKEGDEDMRLEEEVLMS